MPERCYVLNDMGTGKTRSALWAWDWLNKNKQAGKLLVVGKLSTLVLTWMKEVFEAIPHRKAVVLHGDKATRLKRLADPDADIFIINHDGVKVIYEDLYARDDIDTICIDELAAFRNVNDRMKTMAALAHVKRRVWGMTGSPRPQEPTDVWAQARIVTPATVPRYRGSFRDQVMVRDEFDPTRWKERPGANDIAYSALQPAVRFTLNDVVELPETIYRTVDVELSDEQKSVYSAMKNAYHAAVQNHDITAMNAGVAVGKLLQIAGGWVYSPDRTVVALNNKKRVEALIDLIESAAHKVIVAAPYLHTVDGLAAAIRAAKISCAVLHKGLPQKQIDQIVGDFENTSFYKVIVSHPRRLSHGLNLTSADTAIWYLPDPSYETYEQMNARIIRVGQKHKQSILHMRGTAAEKRIYDLLSRRGRMQDEFLTMFEGDI